MQIGLGFSMAGGRGVNAPSAPAISAAAWAFVARDISGSTWAARRINGATALSLTAVGSPVLGAAAWASGVPILDCAAGCFYADRTPWAADYGFSIAFTAGSGGTTFPIYNGPVLFANTDLSAIRLRRQTATLINARAGDGLSGRASVWTGTYALGDTLQFDRPAGAGVALSSWLAYKEGAVQTMTTLGTAAPTSDGPRLIIGGTTDAAGVITANADNNILAVVISQSGAPFSDPDRAAVTTWLAALRSNALV